MTLLLKMLFFIFKQEADKFKISPKYAPRTLTKALCPLGIIYVYIFISHLVKT